MRPHRPMRPRKDSLTGQKALLATSMLLITASVVYAASFFASDLVSQWRAERAFSSMVADSSVLDEREVEAQMEAARAYNARIAGPTRAGDAAQVAPDGQVAGASRHTTAGQASRDMSTGQAGRTAQNGQGTSAVRPPDAAGPELPAYDGQLALAGDVICWLEIPRLSLKVPVYRGAEDAESTDELLMAGAVHLRETSLPVGGASTRAVITAHSGMRNARMFDQLDRLEEGDAVIVHVLGEKLFYAVRGQETVKPGDVGRLGIEEGEDLMTLVTCRPIGVNTSRLLVHAARTAPPAPGRLAKTADWLVGPRTFMFAGALAVAAIAIGSATLAHARSSRRRSPRTPEAPC